MANIKKNYLYNVLYQFLIMFLPLFTAPYVSRVIGADGLGIFYFTHSISNYFLLFAMLGVMNYGNRLIASVREDKEKLSEAFWNIYLLQLVFTIAIVIVYFGYVFVFSESYTTILVIQSLYIIGAAFNISWFFFGLEEFKLTISRDVIIKIATVGMIFTFVNDKNDLVIYTLIMAGGMLLSHMIMWRLLFRRVRFILPSWKNSLSHLKPNLMLFIPVIAISLYKIMDKIMIGSLSSVTEVGYYVNAEKIINIPMGIIVALGSVMLPRMSHMVAKGETEKSKKYIENSMYFILFLSSALAFGIAAIAPEFIPLFFGREFIPTVHVVIFLTPIIVFISWANVIRTQYLIPNKKDKIYIYSVSIGALVNLVVNFLLISRLGALGAAFGTLGAELSVAVIQTIAVKKELNIWDYFLSGLPFYLFGLIMYTVVRLVSMLELNGIVLVLIQVALGALTYGLLSVIYFFTSKNHIINGPRVQVLSRLTKLKEL